MEIKQYLDANGKPFDVGFEDWDAIYDEATEQGTKGFLQLIEEQQSIEVDFDGDIVALFDRLNEGFKAQIENHYAQVKDRPIFVFSKGQMEAMDKLFNFKPLGDTPGTT